MATNPETTNESLQEQLNQMQTEMQIERDQGLAALTAEQARSQALQSEAAAAIAATQTEAAAAVSAARAQRDANASAASFPAGVAVSTNAIEPDAAFELRPSPVKNDSVCSKVNTDCGGLNSVHPALG